MKIKDLTNAPQWLKDAVVTNEDVEIDEYGRVVWRDGVWRGGVWCGGVWCGGVWCGGVWRDGVWRDGVWRDGPRLYVRIGYDLRNYCFMLNMFGDDIRIVAGCRSFSIKEARVHWQSDDYENSGEDNKALIGIFLDSADRIIKEVWKK
jgi:hypothetical protein